ncbi:MAG: GntR family transcriptional regulator [Thalassobium sp.]|nr:MAG: GntR family transcriptional regulator [Thalassobium sp.]
MKDQSHTTTANPPAHELTYRALRDMVLFGELAPGQPVTIQGLVASLGTGITPVREAIRRLTAEGALEAKGNRRIAVPVLDLRQLEQLSFARTQIEPHLASLATARIDAAQIERLATIDDALNNAIQQGDIRGYLEHNHAFHSELYDAADAQILAGMAAALWLRVGPSLRVVCGRIGTQNLPDMHDEALRAMRAGDAAAVAAAIAADIAQGHAHIRLDLSSE